MQKQIQISITAVVMLLALLVSTVPVLAQVSFRDVGISTDGEFNRADEVCFCSPGVPNKSKGKGVEFRYEIQGGFPFRFKDQSLFSENSDARVAYHEHFVGKFKMPLVNKPNFKVLFGYEYVRDVFHFDEMNENHPALFRHLDGLALRNNKFSAYFTKSWNDTYYSIARVRVATRGDFRGFADFQAPFVTYSGAAAFGKKVTDVTEWGVGFTFSSNQLRTLILPFGVYNHNFSEKWGIETVIPVSIFVRHNINSKNILLLGARLDTRTYYLSWETLPDDPGIDPFFFRQADIRVEARLQHQIDGWLWAYVNAGMINPFNFRFDSLGVNATEIRVSGGTRPMIRLGLFLTPPQSLIK